MAVRDKENLLSQLPRSFRHEISDFKEVESGYSATIRCNCESKEDFDRWLKDYQEASFTTWNVRRDFDVSTKLRFRRDLICRLSNYRHKKLDGPRCKARDCEATMVFRVKIDSRRTRSTDPYIKVSNLSSAL